MMVLLTFSCFPTYSDVQCSALTRFPSMTCDEEAEAQAVVEDGGLQLAGQHQPGGAQVHPGLGLGAPLQGYSNCCKKKNYIVLAFLNIAKCCALRFLI